MDLREALARAHPSNAENAEHANLYRCAQAHRLIRYVLDNPDADDDISPILDERGMLVPEKEDFEADPSADMWRA